MSRLSLFTLLSNGRFSFETKVQFLFEKSTITKSGRRVVWFDGKSRYLSHILWNLHHPNDPVLPDEVVHHKNEDRLDDRIENYEKMSKEAHDSLHRPQVVEAMRTSNLGKKRSKEVVEKVAAALRGRTATESARHNMASAKLGTKQSEETKAKKNAAIRATKAASMRWSPEEAVRLRSLGITKRSVARMLGVRPFAITEYFKTRGLPW